MDSRSISRALALGVLVLPVSSLAQDVIVSRLTSGGTHVQFNGGALAPALSPDGRYVVFVSGSFNIGPPSNGTLNVYRYDRVSDQYDLAMQALGIGTSFAPSVSDQGLHIAFESEANNIGGGNPSQFVDVFYSEAFPTGQGEIAFNTYQVSNAIGGFPTNGESRFASISANGRWVAFHSHASNLIAGDGNAAPDIFVADSDTLFATAPERISVDGSGAQIAGPSRALSPSSISGDGRFVVFAVDTPVSIDGSDPGTLEDVFVRDRTAATTSLVSRSTAGVPGNSSSDQAAISPNGRYVAFRSFSSNLVAAPSGSRVYVRDRQNGTTSNLPLPPGGVSCEDPRVSDVGDVAIQCNMESPSQSQAFLYRPAGAGAFHRLSTSQSVANGNGVSGNYTGISADGNALVFDSSADDLVPAGQDSNVAPDVFLALDAVTANRLFMDGFEQ